ncbi:lysozyme C [Bombina bombina]|uniref:lysozyme C n=1 Tax=Bombina bombina TaxID=8345 RepID=UPI00235AA0C0|nr:lysozyme C [Bombina bombina]
MQMYLVLVLVALAGNSFAMDRCSVVRALRNGGVVGIKGYTLGDYVCLVHYASYYDEYLNRSPSEYGIFQINSYWWCDDGRTVGRKNLCGVPCRNLLGRYLGDDIRCLKRIVNDPNGLGAWSAWRNNCQGRDLSRFTSGC